jgi:hydroxymethylbilane synthase
MAAHAVVNKGDLQMRAVVVSLDGRRSIENETNGPATEAETLGTKIAEDLLQKGAAEIMAGIKATEDGAT